MPPYGSPRITQRAGAGVGLRAAGELALELGEQGPFSGFGSTFRVGFAEPVIGPATSGRTRWLSPPYASEHAHRGFA